MPPAGSAGGTARYGAANGLHCIGLVTEMQLYVPEAARLDGVYYPRHFLMQAGFFAPEQIFLVSSLAEVVPGEWALLIRAPGAFSLSRQSLDMRDRKSQPTVFEEITAEEMRALRYRRGALIIDLGWEMLFAYDDVLEGLVTSIEALDLDPARVFLVHCNFSAGPLLQKKWAERTSSPAIQNIAFPVTLALMNIWQHRTRSPAEIEDRLSRARTALIDSTRPKRFSFFNGEPRPHRLMILCHLKSRGVLDAGFVSMLGYLKGNQRGGEATSEVERYKSFVRKAGAPEEVVAAVDDIVARLPLELDVGADEVQQSLEQIAWSSPAFRFYDESWFSLVADTLFFDENVLFVTEKVMKPIVNASPFFYFGCAGGLAHLRKWGFKLHRGPFGAEYDSIKDSRCRMEIAVDAVVRACQMKEADLRDAVVAEWPVVAHNYRHFWWGYRDRLTAAFREQVLSPVAAAARHSD